MSWWQLAVDVPPAQAEAVAWLLAEATGQATEIQDPSTMSRVDGARVVLSLATPPDDDLRAATARALADAGAPDAPVHTRRSEDEGWRDGWRAFFRPAVLSPRIGVHPPWAAPPAVAVPVTIEPGMAFGTGSHATTRGVARALDTVLASRPGAGVLDVGCGSGLLTIAAARLGHPAVGVEIDPVALENARHNGRLNGVSEQAAPGGGSVRWLEGSAADVPGTFPVVVANILAEVLIEIAPHVVSRCSADLLLSGLLRSQEAAVLEAYAGMEVVSAEAQPLEGDESEGWLVLHLRR